MDNNDMKPETDLVRDLMAIRKKAIEKGLRLLSVDEILELQKKRWLGLEEDDPTIELEKRASSGSYILSGQEVQ